MYSPTPRQINRLLILPALVAVLVIAFARGQDLSSRAVGQDAPAASVVVDAFPDLAGEGAYWPDCPGCDGSFRAGDALLAEEDPLPTVQIRLVDASGREQLLSTRAMSEGRQQAIFELDAVQAVTLSLAAVPEGWATCPERRDELVLGIEDFEDRQARLEFALSPTCRPPGVAVAAGPADDEQDEAAEDEATSEEETDVSTPDESLDEPALILEPAAATSDDKESDSDDPETVADEDTGPGSVRGIVFRDANQNGRPDADEAGLPDVLVFLDGDDTSRRAFSDARGLYVFEDLEGLAYDVAVDVPEGWTTVNGDRYARLAVDGRALAGVDFALAEGEDDPDAQEPQANTDDAGTDAAQDAADDAVVDSEGSADTQDTCRCDGLDDPYGDHYGWVPWGGLPSTGLAGLSLTPGRGMASVAIVAGLLGMLGLAFERRRRPGKGA